MASREGIALLSMYNDDEEEDEEGEQEEAPQPTPPPLNESAAEVEEMETEDEEGQIRENTTVADSEFPFEKPFQSPVSQESPSSDEDGESKTLITHVNSTPTPSPISRTPSKPNLSSSSSISSGAERMGFRRSRMDALGIVDYEHDDTAMSPEKEENDNADAAYFVQGTEVHNAVGVLEERVTSAVQVSTPNSQPSVAQPSEQPVISSTESTGAIDVTVPGSEMPHHELHGAGYAETEEAMDPLKKFLPPPPTTKCTHELQDKISKFLSLKKFGKSFNAELRKLKDYRNPDFLQHAVRYQGINQTGTCFSKDVFNPQGYDPRDYFDEIEADMRREIERRDQERKRSPKVEFVSGGTQHSAVVPAKINGIPGTGLICLQSSYEEFDCISYALHLMPLLLSPDLVIFKRIWPQFQFLPLADNRFHLIPWRETLGPLKNPSGTRLMLMQGNPYKLALTMVVVLDHMQHFYLLLIWVLDIQLLRSKRGKRQRKEGRVRESLKNDHDQIENLLFADSWFCLCLTGERKPKLLR